MNWKAMEDQGNILKKGSERERERSTAEKSENEIKEMQKAVT